MSVQQYDSIVFYDGDCGFCNSSVQFILKKRKREFFFCPLQSDFAKEHLATKGIVVQIDTIYYSLEGKVFERSTAALKICKGLRGGYPAMQLFYIVPRFLRDWVYDGIAKRRHRIRAGYCAIPTEEEKKLFIEQVY